MIKNLTAFLGPNLVDLDAKLAPAIPGGNPIAS
jgi:hypothetical protein